MLDNMATAVGGEGLTSLYWNFAPFLIKGLPYDVAELFSYSQLTQHQESVPVLSALPLACRDCIIGQPPAPLRCQTFVSPVLHSATSMAHRLRSPYSAWRGAGTDPIDASALCTLWNSRP